MAKNQKVPQSGEQGGQPESGTYLQSQPSIDGGEAEIATPSKLLARVLAHCYLGEPDDVVEIDAELAASLTELVDTTPAAVEYAQSLKA